MTADFTAPPLRGRPRRRRSAADFALPPLPALEPLGRPDVEYELLTGFAGCHVDPDDPAVLMGMTWAVIGRLAKSPDSEAIQTRRDLERGIIYAAQDQAVHRLRSVLATALGKIQEGFPTRAERSRRLKRAHRLLSARAQAYYHDDSAPGLRN